MARLALDRHAAVAAVAAALSLGVAAPALGGSDGPVSVVAKTESATANAAAAGTRPADRFPIGGPSLQTAMRVAGEHWGAAPCGGNVALEWTAMDEGTNATASWSNPTDAWNNVDANFSCKISLNGAIEYDWQKLCSVVAHEAGHLRGQQHVDADGQLMSPIYSGPLGACARTPDPAAPAAAPAARTSAPSKQKRSTPKRTVKKKKSTARSKGVRRLCARSSAQQRRSSRKLRRLCGTTRTQAWRWSNSSVRRSSATH